MFVHYIFVTLIALILFVWILRQIRITNVFKREPYLERTRYSEPPQEAPIVSVIIPALNEEGNIANCIDSILQQDYPNVEIIVADDRSTDSTPQIVEKIAETHKNVRLLQITELPAGWTGKCNALFQARKIARGQWLLFIDADTTHDRANLRQTVNYCQENSVDMLSLLPHLKKVTFWEKVLQPTFGALLMLRFPIEKVNSKNHPVAFANGQYILIKSDVYDAVGGHETVKDYFLEDIALAKVVKSNGYALNVAYGNELSTTRMYASFKQIWKGWARIFYAANERKASNIIKIIVLSFVFSIVPFIYIITGGILLLCGIINPFTVIYFAAGALSATLILVTFLRLSKISEPTFYQLSLYLVGIIIIEMILFVSLKHVYSKKGVSWRGTTYTPKQKLTT